MSEAPDHGREDEVGLRVADLVQHRAEFRAAERDVFLAEKLASRLLQPDLRVLVRLLRPHVVRADEEDLLAEVPDHEGDQVLGMLVGERAGADGVLRALRAFVAGRIVEQVIALHDRRQDRLAARRGVAAEERDHLVAQDQLLGLLRIDGEVRLGVDDHRLDGHARHAAGLVDLVDRVLHDEGGVLLRNRERSGEREQQADLDRLALLQGGAPRFAGVGQPKMRQGHGSRSGKRGLQNIAACDAHIYDPSGIEG